MATATAPSFIPDSKTSGGFIPDAPQAAAPSFIPDAPAKVSGFIPDAPAPAHTTIQTAFPPADNYDYTQKPLDNYLQQAEPATMLGQAAKAIYNTGVATAAGLEKAAYGVGELMARNPVSLDDGLMERSTPAQLQPIRDLGRDAAQREAAAASQINNGPLEFVGGTVRSVAPPVLGGVLAGPAGLLTGAAVVGADVMGGANVDSNYESPGASFIKGGLNTAASLIPGAGAGRSFATKVAVDAAMGAGQDLAVQGVDAIAEGRPVDLRQTGAAALGAGGFGAIVHGIHAAGSAPQGPAFPGPQAQPQPRPQGFRDVIPGIQARRVQSGAAEAYNALPPGFQVQEPGTLQTQSSPSDRQSTKPGTTFPVPAPEVRQSPPERMAFPATIEQSSRPSFISDSLDADAARLAFQSQVEQAKAGPLEVRQDVSRNRPVVQSPETPVPAESLRPSPATEALPTESSARTPIAQQETPTQAGSEPLDVRPSDTPAPQSTTETGAGKREPWEMTKAEYRQKNADNRNASGSIGATPFEGARIRTINGKPETIGAHEAAVRDALAKGESVPPEVLKDYPDLAHPAAASGDASPAKSGGEKPYFTGPKNPVRYTKGSSPDKALKAAYHMTADDKPRYVYATQGGLTISKDPPPGNQNHWKVNPDGTVAKNVQTDGKAPGDIMSDAAKDRRREVLKNRVAQGQDIGTAGKEFAGEDWVPASDLPAPPDRQQNQQQGKAGDKVADDQSLAGTHGGSVAGQVATVPIQSLSVDPARFQYKSGMGEGGAGGLLRGVQKFDPQRAGVVAVWKEPSTGNTYVINGHHRYELAKRTGQKNLNVINIEAANDSEARSIGAMINIAEGRGTATDAAKVFRAEKMSEQDLSKAGISLTESVARNGLALSKLSPPIFERVARGDIPEARAVAIGESLADPSHQQALLSLLDKQEARGRTVTNDEIKELARFVQGAGTSTETTLSLFGSEQITKSNALEKARLSAWFKRQLKSDSKLFGIVGRSSNAEKLREAGNVINEPGAKEISQDAAEALWVYDKLSGSKGPVSDALNESAALLAKGGNFDEISKSLKQKLTQAITEPASPKAADTGPVEQSPERGQESPPSSIKTDLFGKSFIDSSGVGDQKPLFHQPNEAAPTTEKIKASKSATDETNTGKMFGGDASYSAPRIGGSGPEGTGKAITLEKSVEMKPIPLPEMLRMTRDLLGDKVPNVKNIRAKGYFKHVQDQLASRKIEINPSLGESPVQLAGVLAHEVGHLIDFLPDATLKRGNIGGRLLSLRNYLKGTVEGAPPVKVKELRDELMKVSEWWRPGDMKSAYRRSSKELYADAMSVLLNSPGDLAERAPKFFKSLMDNMDRKPEVKKAYFDTMDTLNGTPETIAELRRMDIREMFGKGEETWKARYQESLDTKQSVASYIGQTLMDRNVPVIAPERTAMKKVVPWSESLAAKHALEEFNMSGTELHIFGQDILEKVDKPLKAAGVERGDLNEFRFLTRVAFGDRGGAAEAAQRQVMEMTGKTTWAEAKADYINSLIESGEKVADDELLILATSGKINPKGYTPETAREQLKSLRETMGDKYGPMVKASQSLTDLAWERVKDMADAGIISKSKLADLETNKDHYSPFAVIKYLDTKVKAGIFKQVGTFEDIANPVDAMVMKTVSMIRLTELNKAKQVTIDSLQKYNPDVIGPGELIDQYHQMKPAKGGREKLIVFRDGKAYAHDVDPYIATAFQSHDIGSLRRAARSFSSATYNVFHPLWIGWNIGWQTMNLPRDLMRTWTNAVTLHADEGITKQLTTAFSDMAKVGKAYVKPETIRAAWDNAREKMNPLIRQMQKERALGGSFSKRAKADILDANQFDRFLQETGVWEKPESRYRIIRGLSNLLDGVETIGTFMETLPKLAMYDLATKAGKTSRERAYIVRNYSGTPNTTRRGTATDLSNTLLPYSNVILQGLRADAEIALNPRTAAGRAFRASLVNYLPKAAMAAGAAGVFGAAVKSFMNEVPEYDKAKYTILPLGRDENGKPVYMRLPHNDTDRMAAALFWKSLKGSKMDPSEMFGIAAGESPGVNPYVTMASKWSQYASGQNPRDDFRGRDILTMDEQRARGLPAFKKMVWWTTDQTGQLGTLVRAAATNVGGKDEFGQDASGVEKTVGAIPGLSRMIKVSNRGEIEAQNQTIQDDEAEDAKLRISFGPNVKRANVERTRLNKLDDSQLSPSDQDKKAMLKKWYPKYTKLREKIVEAKQSGNTAETNALIAELNAMTLQYR